MIPTEMLVMPWYLMASELRLAGHLLGHHVPGHDDGFGTFLMKQFFEGVPDDFLEAARIDGLNEFQIWWQVAMPLVDAGPVGARDLHLPRQLDGVLLAADRDHRAANSTRCRSGSRASRSSSPVQWEMIMTGASIATLPTLVVFLVLQRYIVRGVMLAGLKG